MNFLKIVSRLESGAQIKRAINTGIIVSLITCICLLSANVIAQAQDCVYIPGDVNNVQGATALSDVVYFVEWLSGGTFPPVECGCIQDPNPYPACDVNGNCQAAGIDVTFMVSYYKGFRPQLLWCPDCPPSLLSGNVYLNNPPPPLLDPNPGPDKIWLGPLDGSAIDIVMGGAADIPIYVLNDEPVPAITISVTTDNHYLTPIGGTFELPLSEWADRSYLTPDVNLPTGRTTQSILSYRYLGGMDNPPFLNTGGAYWHIATLRVAANFEPDNVGDDTEILFGAGSRVGQSAFCDELGTEEWTPLPQDFHPVTLHILQNTSPFIAGKVYNDADGDCVKDADENGLSGWTVMLNSGEYSTITNTLGNYVFEGLPPGDYRITQVIQTNWHQTCPDTPPYYDILNYSGEQLTGKDFANRATWVSGRVFYDIDGDCIQDQDEDGLRDWTLRLVPGIQTATSDIDGNFIFVDPPAGSYTLTEDLQADWERTCPPGGYPILLDEGDQFEGKNFGNRPIGDFIDLSVDVGGGRARPGTYKAYGVRYINRGTLATGATVTLKLPDEVQYTSCVFCGCWPDCDFDNAHTLTWNLAEIAPDESGNLTAYVFVPLLDLGTELLAIADITPLAGSDIYPFDNHIEETQRVRMSYDPNEKQVAPEGIIERTDRLTYQIDFQNTGTDTAYDVYVIDTLEQNLDISTFISGASIHPYTYAVDGRVVTWTFANIMLPDSIASEPGSHGFVRFGIYPASAVPAGTFIYNKAGIVFDINEPVITNIVSNQIAIHANCVYDPGDVNGFGGFTGLDVVYAVAYLKGGPPPPYSCPCPPPIIWYVTGDVNGSCTFTGLDVTYMVAYLKGGPALRPCPDCPPAGMLAPPVPAVEPIRTPILKGEAVIKATD